MGGEFAAIDDAVATLPRLHVVAVTVINGPLPVGLSSESEMSGIRLS